MMLLRTEQQKVRILKMSRDFTDLPTDKLADLKNKENFDRISLRSLSQKSKNKRKKSGRMGRVSLNTQKTREVD